MFRITTLMREVLSPTPPRPRRASAARAIAFVGMALSVGPAVGPIVGGVLEVAFGWRATSSRPGWRNTAGS